MSDEREPMQVHKAIKAAVCNPGIILATSTGEATYCGKRTVHRNKSIKTYALVTPTSALKTKRRLEAIKNIVQTILSP